MLQELNYHMSLSNVWFSLDSFKFSLLIKGINQLFPEILGECSLWINEFKGIIWNNHQWTWLKYKHFINYFFTILIIFVCAGNILSLLILMVMRAFVITWCPSSPSCSLKHFPWNHWDNLNQTFPTSPLVCLVLRLYLVLIRIVQTWLMSI